MCLCVHVYIYTHTARERKIVSSTPSIPQYDIGNHLAYVSSLPVWCGPDGMRGLLDPHAYMLQVSGVNDNRFTQNLLGAELAFPSATLDLSGMWRLMQAQWAVALLLLADMPPLDLPHPVDGLASSPRDVVGICVYININIYAEIFVYIYIYMYTCTCIST